MKTFKSKEFDIKKVHILAILTLHHISCGLYWQAPAGDGMRLVTISLHLPFFLCSVSFVVKKQRVGSTGCCKICYNWTENPTLCNPCVNNPFREKYGSVDNFVRRK